MTLLGVLAGLGLVLAGSELSGLAKFASLKLVKAAVSKLPEHRQESRGEEWLGEWDAWDGAHVSRLMWALGLLVAAQRSARRVGSLAPVVVAPPRLRGWRRFTDGDRTIYAWLPTLQEVLWGGVATLLLPFEGRIYYVESAAVRKSSYYKRLPLSALDWDTATRIEVKARRVGAVVHVEAQASRLVAVTTHGQRRNIRMQRVDRAEVTELRPIKPSGVRLVFMRIDLTTGQQELAGVCTTGADGKAALSGAFPPSDWHVRDLSAPPQVGSSAPTILVPEVTALPD